MRRSALAVTLLATAPVALAALAACDKKAAAPAAAGADAGATPAGKRYDKLSRADFNRWAVRENVPIYWTADADGDGSVDPDEIVTLRFYPTSAKAAWTDDGHKVFTGGFDKTYKALVAAAAAAPPDVDPSEAARQKLVGEDLDGGRATLVYSDLRGLPADHRAFAGHIVAAADKIDALYDQMSGAAALVAQVAPDAASQALFRRNRGPKCVTPKVEKDPTCTAVAGAPKPVVDVYPEALQADPEFCAKLAKRADAKALTGPFTVLREKDGQLVAVPYHEVYGEPMKAIAADLEAAAAALTDPAEEPLRAYLRAAAKAFTDNDWAPADEAWAKMSATNSRWYLRIGPDETYWEPCAYKAGFHVSFALINQGSLAWQKKLQPVQQEMEDAVAARAGAPYKARQVTFDLPDFIDIVINAGDSRGPLGATIGQSLPNVGAVAEESRGRTVAMSNLYTDPDSIAIRRQQAESLLDAASMAAFTDSTEAGLVSTILHEACHNLGPSHDYAVRGKTDQDAFGGPIASVMEELKAQTCGIFLVELLRQKGILSDAQARATLMDSLVWAMGHVSQGMYTGDGDRKAYSQLAAIQLGILVDAGALVWDPAAKAANGKDVGAFVVKFDALPAAIDKMMVVVGGIKARADKAGAEKLIAAHVDGGKVPKDVITERFLRFPKASFVYAFDL